MACRKLDKLIQKITAHLRDSPPFRTVGMQGGHTVRTVIVLVGAGLSAAVSAGCGDHGEITRYTVPKAPEVKSPGNAGPAEPGETVETRVLGAIVPRKEQTWFFKLMGPADDVDQHAADFRKFVGSLRFTEGDNGTAPHPEWTLPEGWREEPGSQMRFATIRLGADSSALELSVIPLPHAVSALSDEREWILQNVNRWRGQVGLQAVSRAELSDETETIALSNGTATVVNLLGQSSGSPMGRIPFAGHPPIGGAPFAGAARPALGPPGAGSEGQQGGNGLTFTVPKGWSAGKAGAMRQAAFEVHDGQKQVEITVINLPGAAGDLLANVNRWRGQIELSSVTQAELDGVLEPISVNGTDGNYVELIGPDKAILGAIVNRAGRTWFFKLKGDAELARQEKPRFRAFVESVKFQ